jgi:hypothetical protein
LMNLIAPDTPVNLDACVECISLHQGRTWALRFSSYCMMTDLQYSPYGWHSRTESCLICDHLHVSYYFIIIWNIVLMLVLFSREDEAEKLWAPSPQIRSLLAYRTFTWHSMMENLSKNVSVFSDLPTFLWNDIHIA